MKNIFPILVLLLTPFSTYAISSISELSPVAHYNFDESSGVAYDETDNSNDLTNVNTVEYVTGLLNNAADFEVSNNEYFYINDNSSLSLTDEISISFWANLESCVGTYSYVGSKWSLTYRSYYVTFYNTDATTCSLSSEVRDSSGNYSRTYSNLAKSDVVNNWNHYVVTFNSTNGYLTHYMNSVDVTTARNLTNATGIVDGNDITTIGRLNYNPNPKPFDGKIDHYTIFDTNVDDYVSDLYNSGSPLPYLPTVATTTPIVVLPYNQDMPKIETITASGTDYIINYATSTEVYLTPDVISTLFISLMLFGILMGYIAYKFL